MSGEGESEEGEEMDTFRIEGEEVGMPLPSDSSEPTSYVDRLSPAPIVNSEILSTIPLPGESYDNFLLSDISPSETSPISSQLKIKKKRTERKLANKIVLKYSYKEDQWSPLNPEGKKQYDRDFLLQLQSQAMSMTKPSNLPNLDVIKDKAFIQRLTEVRIIPPMVTPLRTFDPFMPNYARQGPPRMPHEVSSKRLDPDTKRMQSRNRSSYSGTKTDDLGVNTTWRNRYAASIHESSYDDSNQLPPAESKMSSTSEGRRNLLVTAINFDNKTQPISNEAGFNLNGKTTISNRLCLGGPNCSEEDDMEIKTQPIIDEFLYDNNLEKAMRCVAELASPNTVHMFISSAIIQILDCSSQAWNSLGKLLYSLMKNEIITLQHYRNGFAGFLACLDDLVVDFPLIRKYMGEIMKPLTEDNEFPITLLDEILQPVMPSELPRNISLALLHRIANRKNYRLINRCSQTAIDEKSVKFFAHNFLLETVKLHESENAWKPAHKSEPTAGKDPEELEKEKLKRSVQGVLNKLTPQKFDILLNQMKHFNMDTEEKLNVVIGLIFENAIIFEQVVDAPNFSVPYANLCRQLALIKVPLVGGQPGQMVNFRKLLLAKCQKEFEKDRCDEIKHEERMKAIEATEPDKQKELKLEYEEEDKKMKYRQLGNIRFTGELFKLGMLIEPIMHECMKKFLSQGDEASLECLCQLLKSIGKELDENKTAKGQEHTNLMDVYFTQMQKVVDKQLTSSRVRFILQDVIDLKWGNWVPQRKENYPKTIDQIHKEAELKAGRNIGLSKDEWTPLSKSNNTSYSVVDPTKLKLIKPYEVHGMRLGPGIRRMQSFGRAKTTDADIETILTIRSAASSNESSCGRSNQLPPAIRKMPSASKERENLLETVKGLARNFDNKAQEVKRAADLQLNGKATDSEALYLRGPEYSEDDMERKTKLLIDEFLHNNDFEEAVKCVTELASPNNVQMFINAAINQVLERSSQARISLGTLLRTLVKKNIITLEHYKKGFAGIWECLDDYVLNIPLIREYMGEVIAPMIEDNEFPITLLNELLQPCIPSATAGKVVSAVLHSVAKRKGTFKLGEIWRKSGLQWSDFLGNDINISEFIQKRKLYFTLIPEKVKPITPISIEEIKINLSSLLEKNEQNEEIFDWIDANVPENINPNFIRTLVPSVLRTVISESNSRWELDIIKLKTRSPLLNRYIDHKDNLELQALYSVQGLMNELNHPSGLLHQIFDVLYDNDIIAAVSFKKWKFSDDPNESEGKFIAMNSARSFFAWLSDVGESPGGSADEEADE